MNQVRFTIILFVLCATTGILAGCFGDSADKLPGRWQYVVLDATSPVAPDFRAFLTFGQPGSGGMGTFRYQEEMLLPDDDEGTVSWHPSYRAEGFYRTAPYGYPGASDIFTYWADTELNVIISSYAPVLVQTYNEGDGTYEYSLDAVVPDNETPANSRAVLTVNPFDELVVAWGNRVPGQVGTMQTAKQFSINEGLVADTYVRVVN